MFFPGYISPELPTNLDKVWPNKVVVYRLHPRAIMSTYHHAICSNIQGERAGYSAPSRCILGSGIVKGQKLKLPHRK